MNGTARVVDLAEMNGITYTARIYNGGIWLYDVGILKQGVNRDRSGTSEPCGGHSR